MTDRFGRTIDYMRISITDRCNLRCRYCMPAEGIEKIPMSGILTYEQITMICTAAAELGIDKIRITGGEPLTRLGCADLIAMIKQIPGITQVTMTTNGLLLGKYLDELLAAGLDGVNVSLDTADPMRYAYITGGGDVREVFRSIDMAIQKALPIKLNSVLQSRFSDAEWEGVLAYALSKGIDIRFIELMPIGYAKGRQGVSNVDLLRRIREKCPGLTGDFSRRGNGPAQYYQIPGWDSRIGFISALHEEFCGGCNRIRLTSQGQIKPCLCYEERIDLRPFFLLGKERLKEELARAVTAKPERHCFREPAAGMEQTSMMRIGG